MIYILQFAEEFSFARYIRRFSFNDRGCQPVRNNFPELLRLPNRFRRPFKVLHNPQTAMAIVAIHVATLAAISNALRIAA
jgi:hypothetical protein